MSSSLATTAKTSDQDVIDHLRRTGTATIADLSELLGVTATAVRQRLSRLVELELVKRVSEPTGRGRPTHRYSLTAEGKRSGGNNYDQLAEVLWEELRSIKDPEVRRGLLQRVVSRLAAIYRDQVNGETLDQRMHSLARVLSDRNMPFDVDRTGALPVLTAVGCPYPDLAEQDRSICAMEKMMFSEVLGKNLRLSDCRLDGDNCCTFEATSN